ncbi:hypothetical protein CPB83DRAFT_908473 [Crepidotus variabilis]|uniref:DUF6534 domain-containing protein n=1 Tax=Crepidotus variabilis TaxID=179855 RepID=A0A9P6ECG3_9AGAR|nr:hypothetical protein CPB83DRAFT_908473 [Crepidotus variabilis]
MHLAQATVIASSRYYSALRLKAELLVKTTAIQGGAAALCVLLISATLCYIFHFHRSGNKRTDSIVNKLIIYAIERAIATSLCAILSVLLYYFCSGTYYFLIPQLANTHLYLISAVSRLTSREALREQAEPSFHFSHLDMTTTTRGDRIIGSGPISSTILAKDSDC